jgi:hypothetical protein
MADHRQPVLPVVWADVDDRQGPIADALVSDLADVLDTLGLLAATGTLVDGAPPGVVEFNLQLAYEPKNAWHVMLHDPHTESKKTYVFWTRIVHDATLDQEVTTTVPLFDAITRRVAQVLAGAQARHPWMAGTFAEMTVLLDPSSVTAHQRLEMERAHRAVCAASAA